MQKNLFFKFFLCLTLLTACTSYEEFEYLSEEFEIPNKIYSADYNQTWQAVLQVMEKYDIAVKDLEAGVIKTRWMDNTRALNFADSFGGKDTVKAARFKVVMNVVKGFKGGREVAKVTVFKRQMVEQDFLQGWKVVRTDGIMEKTLLYRIERLIAIDNRLRKIEEQKNRELEQSF